MKVAKLLLAAGLLVPLAASGANWKPIPGLIDGFVDGATIRNDEFPKLVNGQINYLYPVTTRAKVAWLFFKKDGIKLEVVFDCAGQYAVMQQVVDTDTASRYHSIDNTQAFRSTGPQFSTIPPDTAYDGAQAIVCPVSH